MKKLMILMMALAVSLSAAAGEKCDGNGDECMTKMKTKLAEKAWLGVEFDKNDYGQKVVKKVHADSPADQAGFQKGDVLLAVGGEKYSKDNKKALKKVYAHIKPGSDVQYVVKRQGAKVELEATLTHVPKDIQEQWIAEHMEKNHPDVQVASNK